MITTRQEKLLNIIIDNYIKTAEPVSSKALVKSRSFSLSSATLRNEMHDLEACGYLAQIHTSGGRIPTDKAYRLYVDNLLSLGDFPITSEWKKKVDSALISRGDDHRDINRKTAKLLSDLTDNVVIAGIGEEDDFYKTGLSSLFELPEFRELDRIFKLTSFFEEFDSIFDQIEREFFGDLRPRIQESVNIFIGRENPIPVLRDESVMTARYRLSDNCVGSLTLIGPIRMDYRRNIGLIKYTTDRLNTVKM